MNKFQWQEGLLQKIDALCEIFPAVIRNRWQDRLKYNSEKIAAYEGSSLVTEDIFWRSVYEVFPGGYEPLILKVKDPVQMMPEKEYAGQWTIDGKTVHVTEDTKIKEKHGKLAVGSYVEVKGVIFEGKFIASEIETKKKK